MSKESLKKEIQSLCQSILESDLDTQCSLMIHKMGKVYNHLLVYNYLNLEEKKAEESAEITEENEIIDGNPTVHEIRKNNREEIEEIHKSDESKVESQKSKVESEESKVESQEVQVEEKQVEEKEGKYESQNLKAESPKVVIEEKEKAEEKQEETIKAEEPPVKPSPVVEATQRKNILADMGDNAPTTVYERLAIKKELSIGLNDKFAFIRDLFEGNADSFKAVMDKINSFPSVEEAKSYFTIEVANQHNWGEEEEETVERFLNIIERKV